MYCNYAKWVTKIKLLFNHDGSVCEKYLKTLGYIRLFWQMACLKTHNLNYCKAIHVETDKIKTSLHSFLLVCSKIVTAESLHIQLYLTIP